MWKVLVGGSGCLSLVPLYWPCQEMMPMPTSHTGSHTADFQSSGGRLPALLLPEPVYGEAPAS